LIIGTLLIIVGVQLVLFGLLAEMIAFSYRRENDYSIIESSDTDEAFHLEATGQVVGASKGNRTE
jgi:hypothetical protein